MIKAPIRVSKGMALAVEDVLSKIWTTSLWKFQDSFHCSIVFRLSDVESWYCQILWPQQASHSIQRFLSLICRLSMASLDDCSSDTWEEMSDHSETEEQPTEISAEHKVERDVGLKTSSAKTPKIAVHTHAHKHQHFRSVHVQGMRKNTTLRNHCDFKRKTKIRHHVHLEVLHSHHIMDEQGLHHITAQIGTTWMKLDAIASSSNSSSAEGSSSQHGSSGLRRGRAYEDLGEIEWNDM